MNVSIISFPETTAANRIIKKSKSLFKRNREVPLRYVLLASPVLIAVLVVGFIRYFYGRLMHQF